VAENRERKVVPEGIIWNVFLGSMSPAPDRQTVVTRTPEHVTFWNGITGQELGRLPLPKEGITNVAVAVDGKTAAVLGGGDGNVVLYDLPSVKQRCQLQPKPAPSVASMMFSGDGQTLLTTDARGKIRLWEAATGKEKPVNLPPLAPGQYRTLWAAISHDGKAVAAVNTTTVKLWDAQTGAERLSFAFPEAANHMTFQIQFSASGDRLLVSNLKHLKVWDTATGAERPAPKPVTDQLSFLTWSPDGKRLAACDNEGRLFVWDMKDGREVHRFQLPTMMMTSLAFAPDSRHLATGNSNGSSYILRLAPPN
jgi:WD40 repeat protein